MRFSARDDDEGARGIADEPAAHAAEQYGSSGSVPARAGDQEVQVAAALDQLPRGVAGEQDGARGDRRGQGGERGVEPGARSGLDVRTHAVVAGTAHERGRAVAERVEHRDHLERVAGVRRHGRARLERGVRLGGSVERDTDAARPAAGLEAVTERGDGDGTRSPGQQALAGRARQDPSEPARGCRSDDDQRRVALLRERLQELWRRVVGPDDAFDAAGRRPRARRSRRRAGVRRPRRPPGSPRRRSPRRRARAPGTAPRSPAAAPRRPAPRARAPGRARRGSDRTRRSRRRSGSCGTLQLLLGDQPRALRREVQRLRAARPSGRGSGGARRRRAPRGSARGGTGRRRSRPRRSSRPAARRRSAVPPGVSRRRSSARRLRRRRERADERVVRAARDDHDRAARVADHGVRDAAQQHVAGRPVRAGAADEEIDAGARAR